MAPPTSSTSAHLRGLDRPDAKGQITQAVVYDPARDELFVASKGKGAMLNDRRLRVSKQDRLDESLIGTGFPFKRQEQIDAYLSMFKTISGRAAGLRRPVRPPLIWPMSLLDVTTAFLRWPDALGCRGWQPSRQRGRRLCR